MTVLDANGLSALMRHESDSVVVACLDGQPAGSIWTTAVTGFEIRFGIEILASGRRRRSLEDAFAGMLEPDFDGGVLPFDRSVAQAAAAIATRQRQAGNPVEIRGVRIAGIAAAGKATLATRNTRHFVKTGIEFVDPLAI